MITVSKMIKHFSSFVSVSLCKVSALVKIITFKVKKNPTTTDRLKPYKVLIYL